MQPVNQSDVFRPMFFGVEDPILHNKPKTTYAVIKGGTQTTERVFSSSTWSNSSVQFNTPPPSPNTFMSRKVLLKVPMTIKIISSAVDAYRGACATGYDALRQAPLASIIQSLDLVINGQSCTLSVNDIVKPLLVYHNPKRDLSEREMSTSPMLRDQVQDYNMQAPYPGVPGGRNALGGFGSSSSGALTGRGSHTYLSVANYFLGEEPPNNVILPAPQQGVTIIDLEITEELFISPLLFGGVEDQGFIGVQSFELNINWDSNLDLIWSRTFDHPKGDATVSVQFNTNPSLLFRYVTPRSTYSIPRFIQYNYNELQRYVTDKSVTLNPVTYSPGTKSLQGTDFSIISNNIQLNSIPRFMYIYVKYNRASRALWRPDYYYAIKGVEINWNNRNALLANASTEQLYEISRKNGVDLSWAEWSGKPMYRLSNNNAQQNSTVALTNNPRLKGYDIGIGSILCLELGTDIALEPGESPGLIGTYNLQVTVNCTNWTQDSSNVATSGKFGVATIPALYILTSIPGIFTIYDNSASKRIGVINKSDVMNASVGSGANYYSLKRDLMSGGMKLKKIARMLYKVAKPASPFIKKMVPAKYHKLFDLGEQTIDHLHNTLLKKPAPPDMSKEKKIVKMIPKIKRSSPSTLRNAIQGSSMVGGMRMSSSQVQNTYRALGI